MAIALCFAQVLPAFAAPTEPSRAAGGDTAPDDTNETAIRDRLDGLEERLSRLHAADWMTTRRSEEIRGLVTTIVADADSRVSLKKGPYSGYKNGYFFESEDGNFRVKFNYQLQVRFVYNHRRDSDDDDDRYGFELRRNKVRLSGHVGDPDWQYRVLVNFPRDGDEGNLQSAWIRRKLNKRWTVRVGQFKLPLLREEGVSSRFQLAVERSLVDRALRPGYSQGIEVAYQRKGIRLRGAYSDGLRTSNTPALEETTEWAFTGRIEARFGGDWDQFRDFTSWPDEEPALLLGAAIHAEREEVGTDDRSDLTIRWTADATLQLGGVNGFAAFIWDNENKEGDRASEDHWGVVGQVGGFVAEDVELYARYEYGSGDDATDLSVLTVGVNRYFHEHKLKVTCDLGYGFKPVDSFWANSGAGWETDEDGKDGQFVLRTQLQLLF